VNRGGEILTVGDNAPHAKGGGAQRGTSLKCPMGDRRVKKNYRRKSKSIEGGQRNQKEGGTTLKPPSQLSTEQKKTNSDSIEQKVSPPPMEGRRTKGGGTNFNSATSSRRRGVDGKNRTSTPFRRE